MLLKLISDYKEVTPLLKNGLSYSQIAELISETLEEKLIQETKGSLKLTPKGKTLLTEITQQKGKWIEPMESMKVEKLSVNDVYLPNEKTVFSRLIQDR